MREYFKQIILNLYLYIGNRQAEKMTEEEVKGLLDALERVSKLYDYIPLEKQKDIINGCLISDKDYQNINARLIAKWLEQNGKVYFTQEHHHADKGKLTEADYTPVEGEQREAYIQQFLNAIANATTNFEHAASVGGGQRMREHFATLPSEEIKPDPKLKRREATAFEEACGITNDMLNEKPESQDTINP